MARDVSIFAAYGAPPLKPAQPIHNKPAPTRVKMMLFGGKLSLSFAILGPTYINEDNEIRIHDEFTGLRILVVFIISSKYLWKVFMQGRILLEET